jgi:Polyketide cyclase / dehydrase and lipid transport
MPPLLFLCTHGDPSLLRAQQNTKISARRVSHCKANLQSSQGDALESITLDGPYQAGSKGTTKMRGQEPIHWRLAEVEPPRRSATEIELTEAVVRFTWTYEELPGGRTRLSQHIVLEGPGAEAYVPFMEEHIARNLPQGMQRLAEEVARHAAGQ